MSKSDDESDDVILNVEGIDFPCNRKKLSKSSAYFEAMFNGNFTEKHEKRIEIKEVKENAIKNILYILEGNAFYIESADLYDTLQGASMLQFDHIKYYCTRQLEETIDTTNCLRIWRVADQLDLHPLTEKAQCKALMDFNIIKERDDILRLNIQELHSYLSNTLLHCNNETDVFETGMKWWYDHSKIEDNNAVSSNKGDDFSYETKCLLVIFRCLDFKSLTKSDIDGFLLMPDLERNSFLRNFLKNMTYLIEEKEIVEETLAGKLAIEMYMNCNRRELKRLACVVCTEYNGHSELSEKTKRTRFMSFTGVKTINIYYFDEKMKSMERLLDLCMQNEDRCNALLEGYHMLPYKENLLFFGGEYQYGTADWNKSLWSFNTYKNEWNLLTRLPKERRHFRTIIIKDKLYIIGGTGKYRIIQSNMMCYDFATGEWDAHIKLPHSIFNIKCCSYRNSLFIISGKFNNRFGFLYIEDNKDWQRINIIDPTGNVAQDMGDYLLFSRGDYIYIKSTYLIKLELLGPDLVVQSCIPVSTNTLSADDIGHCQNENDLYLFSQHTNERDLSDIYLLEKWNLNSNKTQLLLQINDNDVQWNVHSGCFTFFHYSLVRDSICVSDFVF